MSLRRFFDGFRQGRLQPWMLTTLLGLSAGSALGQEAQSFSVQPGISAISAVLMNPTSGEILFAKEPHLRLPPASTTKVLTALVVLERLDPHTRLWASPKAASVPPSRIGLRAGDAAAAQDLLYGLLLKSGNDAAETLAEGAGGSVYGFASLMNAKAWQIGARDSHFINPHGLPDEDHYSTAYDLALIFRQAMNHPLFADIVSTRSAALRIESGLGPYGDWRMVPVLNHNRLLASYEGARGGKTGFTFKARRCFVGEVDRGGVRLIVAILNSPTSGTLWNDARVLFDYGFARYGLAPPPPLRSEPLPVLVRRAPSPPVAFRPLVANPRPRLTVVRPVVFAKPAAPARAKTTASRTPSIARTHVAAKPVVSKPVGSGKPVKQAAGSKPKVASRADQRPAQAAAPKADRRPAARLARAEPPAKPAAPRAVRRGGG
jgi:serine-type D-Ala-D-Ala carboxypeptidase (penicillin-binding protein 5/6)